MTRGALPGLMSRRRLLLAAGLCTGVGGLAIAPLRVHAQTSASEAQIKAAYIYKFGSFVDWPGSAFAATASPIQIGLIEADALLEPLAQAVAGRTLHGRSLVVRRLSRTESPAGLHMVFLGRSLHARMAELLTSLRRSPTLVISESEGALELGSMINFVILEDRLRFEVAPRNAERSGLAISARLLAAAVRVEVRGA